MAESPPPTTRRDEFDERDERDADDLDFIRIFFIIAKYFKFSRFKEIKQSNKLNTQPLIQSEMSFHNQFELSKLNANTPSHHIPYPPTNTSGLNDMVVDGEQVIIRNSYIIVSSLDRDWYSGSSGSESPYKFSVLLGGSGDTWNSMPLYQNSPTVPATQQQALLGIRGSPNIAGWYSTTGQFFLPYDPSQPLGLQVDSETIIFKGTQFMAINHTPKNIISIGVSKLVVSSRNLESGYSTITVNPENQPYLLVSVDNVDKVQLGTNKLIDNAVGVMVPYLPIPTSLASNYFVEYKSLLGNAKEFFNNPIASIPRMVINITTAIGSSIAPSLNDVLTIYSIYNKIGTPADYSTEFLVIQTSTFFMASQYQAGDLLLFKNYRYRDTGIYEEADNFNEFMNNPAGHVIVGIDKSNPATYLYNLIVICAPSVASITSGNVENIPWYSNLKVKSMGTSPIAGDSGKCINSSLQTQVAFNIKYLEKSTNFMDDLL